MLVPAPPPTYTLAPGIAALTAGQQSALEACLHALIGRLGGVLVAGARTTASHHVLELVTEAGSLLAMERIDSHPGAAAA